MGHSRASASVRGLLDPFGTSPSSSPAQPLRAAGVVSVSLGVKASESPKLFAISYHSPDTAATALLIDNMAGFSVPYSLSQNPDAGRPSQGIAMSVGERIKARRSELGWTQELLAQKAGISKSFLSELENGKRLGQRRTICSKSLGL